MIWETAVLNKLHKTKEFTDLWQQEGSKNQAASKSLIETIKHEEINKVKFLKHILDKYGLEEHSLQSTANSYLIDSLKYYDALQDIVEVDSKQYVYWTGLLFKHCNATNPTEKEGDHTHRYALEGLHTLNKHLRLRTCMLGYSATALDVVVISIIRSKPGLWETLKHDDFKGLENIYRLSLWIEGLIGIKWETLNAKQVFTQKPQSKKKNKASKKTTGSKEIANAVKTRNLKEVESLLKANPILINSLDTGNKKASLLHIACQQGDIEMINLLIDNNCNLESLDKGSMTPLFWAIELNNYEVVKLLIERGANLHHKDKFDRTCVFLCSDHGCYDIFKLFLEAGLDLDAQTNTLTTPLIKATARYYLCEKKDQEGFLSIIKAILSSGKVNVNLQDSIGKTALHYCVHGRADTKDPSPDTVGYLGCVEITKMLLDCGADPNIQEVQGNTPLNIACSSKGLNCIPMLMSHGADINLKNKFGMTPFMSACFRGHFECCQILYEYEELDLKACTNDGYNSLELIIRGNQDSIVKMLINEKINNGKEYKGLEFCFYDKEKLLHHSVDNRKNDSKVLDIVIEYIWINDQDTILYLFKDILNRALLRSSKHAVHSLLDFYKHKELFTHFKLTQTVLEPSIHFNDSDTFSQIVEYYDGELPQVALQSAVFTQNYHFATLIVDTFAEQFCNSEISQSAVCVPDGFTQVITNDVLQEYTYFARVAHPIFSDEAQTARFTALNPLQLAVSLDNTKLVKLLLDKTAYKASSLLPNGDNILHLVVSRSEGDSYILQKLLAQLEIETGSAEQVRTQFLEHKNEADGLSVLEFCAGMKIYAPIVFKYSSVAGCPDDDMYGAAEVLNVEIVHEQTPEQEASTDKKALAEQTRLAARQAHKDLIKTTEALAKKYQFAVEYSAECGIDLSDPSYTKHIPSIKDKPCTFIDTLEALEQCGAELTGQKVLGVDLEFAGDKRIAIASLLQISTLEADYVVDALVLRHAVGPVLSPVFGDPAVVKVFHGCDYDILLLLTDLEVEVVNVFDTGRALQEMMRTVSSSEPLMTSFDYLVSAFLGFKANKFFQRAEWRLRPLPKVMLNYARADSHYVLFLYAVLIDMMSEPSKPIALPEETAQEHSEMLEFRSKEPKQWKKVLKEFQKKMAKFMVGRIEKSGKRTYEVVIHD